MFEFNDRAAYRILEIIPGLAIWSTFVAAIILSIYAPIWVVYFVLLFDFYWLLRVCYFVFYLIYAWRRYRRDIIRDWWHDVQSLPRWHDVYHIIFLPTYQESLGIVVTTIENLAQSAYDTKRFIIVLAGEERDEASFKRIVDVIMTRYRERFYDIITTLHPANLPDEMPGKGSNIHWAGKHVKEYIDAAKLPYENLVVSSFDVDTISHPQYFACLTYAYLTHPQPQRTSYQPAVLYNNNLWESPAITRIAAFGTTFWLMTELARPERLLTFSSHSLSWQALVDVGFWSKQVVSEDSRIFLQCLLHYDGDYRVMPLYVPVSMDMVKAKTYIRSLIALYRQQRRWAWGVENLPYMAWHFRRHPKMPLRSKVYYLWNLAEGMYQWATAPLLIFVIGRLPAIISSEAVRQQALFQNAPFVMEGLLQLSMVGILVSVIVSVKLLPPRSLTTPSYKYVTMLVQWILLPFTLVVFGSLPAIDAQTRLMLGRYLGFNVTEKRRTNADL